MSSITDYLLRNRQSAAAGALLGLGGVTLPYLLLPALMSSRAFQRNFTYQHAIRMVPKEDLETPEKFGFAPRQVTSFQVDTPDGESLHAWHILPLGEYLRHEEALLAQEVPAARASGGRGLRAVDVRQTLNLRMLRDDPDARLVIHTHGSRGTLATPWRINNYRALASASGAGGPEKIHVLVFDYRGFGLSTGSPNEAGVIADGMAVFDWAVDVAGVPPERIVIFGQSMGAGAAAGLVHKLLVERGVEVAGLVNAAGFESVASLVRTFPVFGLPLLKPFQWIPGLSEFLCSKLESTWRNADRIADIVRRSKRFYVELVHGHDDELVPWQHGSRIYGGAAAAMMERDEKTQGKSYDLGEGGSVQWLESSRGTLRLSLPLYADHEMVQSHPTLVAAILRAFRSVKKTS